MENNPDNQTIPFRVIPGCTGKEKYKIWEKCYRCYAVLQAGVTWKVLVFTVFR